MTEAVDHSENGFANSSDSEVIDRYINLQEKHQLGLIHRDEYEKDYFSVLDEGMRRGLLANFIEADQEAKTRPPSQAKYSSQNPAFPLVRHIK